jgi:hypothetical protein
LTERESPDMAAARCISFLAALSIAQAGMSNPLAFSPTRVGHFIQPGFTKKSGLSSQPPFLMRPSISNRLSVISMASSGNGNEARNALSRRKLLTALGSISVSSGFAGKANGIVSPLQVFISVYKHILLDLGLLAKEDSHSLVMEQRKSQDARHIPNTHPECTQI